MKLPPASTYVELRRRFRWNIPAIFNIATACCDDWAEREPGRVAIRDIDSKGNVTYVTYRSLRYASTRLASALAARGIRRGDRIAILLPQGRQVAIAHLAAYRLGAIAVPLANLFGVDAIAYRLNDSGARALITDAAGLAKARLAALMPAPLELIVTADETDGDAIRLQSLIEEGNTDFATAATGPDDPALMIYTSGTTGNAKGALHGHRVVPGHLPGVQLPHELMPQPGDIIWTPADWAWAGGLLNVLLPSLLLGVPVIARKFEKFDPEEALALIAAQGVRNTFIPPTALRMLRRVKNPRGRFKLNLRTIGSGGEALGEETFAWGREALGLAINEFYGQTECNLVLASCASIGVSKPGAIGKPVPGHDVAVIRPDGSVCAPDEQGQIAIRRPDPVMFLDYWNKPGAMEAKFIGDWLCTGDQGRADAAGYFHFIGRDDDVITSSGYRIGPGEIEDCLIKHPAVALAAVVGKPDPLRTEIVKAFVVLNPGQTASDALAAEIQAFVRTKLSAHEYPREIEFIAELPLTTTGKVIRRVLRERG